MSDQAHYLTERGLREIEERLEYLRNIKRPEVAARLHLALEEGGELVENAEYEDAKSEQAFLEGEIMRLENILSNAILIEDRGDDGIVSLGDTVVVQEKGTKQTESYHIVGSTEADPAKGRISNDSPMGKALIGRKTGEKVTVKAPSGDIVFTVKKIQRRS